MYKELNLILICLKYASLKEKCGFENVRKSAKYRVSILVQIVEQLKNIDSNFYPFYNVVLFDYAGVNLTGYHPPRADCRATNFLRQIPAPGTAFQCKSPAPGSEKKKQNPHPRA